MASISKNQIFFYLVDLYEKVFGVGDFVCSTLLLIHAIK